MGCWFSVGPAMLQGARGTELVARMPRDRVLTESDGPFARLEDPAKTLGRGNCRPWIGGDLVCFPAGCGERARGKSAPPPGTVPCRRLAPAVLTGRLGASGSHPYGSCDNADHAGLIIGLLRNVSMGAFRGSSTAPAIARIPAKPD